MGHYLEAAQELQSDLVSGFRVLVQCVRVRHTHAPPPLYASIDSLLLCPLLLPRIRTVFQQAFLQVFQRKGADECTALPSVPCLGLPGTGGASSRLAIEADERPLVFEALDDRQKYLVLLSLLTAYNWLVELLNSFTFPSLPGSFSMLISLRHHQSSLRGFRFLVPISDMIFLNK